MPSMSHQFVQKSREATSFNYDTNSYPEPKLVEDVFEWLSDNIVTFTNLPKNFLVLMTDLSDVTFKDGSEASIQATYLNDRIYVVEKRHPLSRKRPQEVTVRQTSTPAYTYFKLMAQRQRNG